MSRLCGAWALDGRPIEALLEEAEARSMKGQLGGPGDALEEMRRGPLWLVSAPGRTLADQAGALAVEGFVDSSSWRPDLLANARRRSESLLDVEGHCVAAFADWQAGSLTLARDPSGGERLYYARLGKLLLFSASVRPLLAHGGISRQADPDMVREYLVNGALFSQARTLFPGVDELEPDEAITFQSNQQRAHRPARYPPPEELAEETCRRLLRDGLTQATAAMIGSRKAIAVALSGGVDSATIAALARDVVGAENVHAFTYEFPDSGLGSEAPYAKSVCRHLGLRDPEIVSIRYRDHLEALPEAVWRCEETGSTRGNPTTMLLSKAVAAAGFDRLLTGNLMEVLLWTGLSRHKRLEDFARLAPRLPAPQWTLAHWRWRKRLGRPGRSLLEAAVPGFSAPEEPYYFIVLAILAANGVIDDIAPFFPSELGAAARRTLEGPGIQARLRHLRHAPLTDQLRYGCFVGHDQGRLLLKKLKLTREAGAPVLAPAAMPAATIHNRHFRWHALRQGSRPSKFLLKEAMRGRLPDEVIDRPKIEDSMIVPQRWFSASIETLRPALEPSARLLLDTLPEGPPLRPHVEDNLLRLALWHRLLVARPLRADPPSLSELEEGS